MHFTVIDSFQRCLLTFHHLARSLSLPLPLSISLTPSLLCIFAKHCSVTLFDIIHLPISLGFDS